MIAPRADDDPFPKPLFMDCVHVREGAVQAAYALIDTGPRPHLGRMLGCRICAECRAVLDAVLQAPPFCGLPRKSDE